jgi:D-beta-D-heptose 7-phosphate kinase/D-beta-D-heptose 1-phosphate adenosyltransferase
MAFVNVDLSKFHGCRVLVMGDLMIDEYLWGEVDRISPEAPVQVVSVVRDTVTLGGAGNVVNNLVALGGQVAVAGVMGAGDKAAAMIKMFAERRVDTAGLIQDPGRSTTRKTRIIGGHQHVLRIDRETRQEISQEQAGRLLDFARDCMDRVDVVLLSDYGKGLLTNSLLRQIIEEACKKKRPVIADPKGLSFKRYAGASLVTPNKKEASLATGIDIVDHASLVAAGEALFREIPIQRVLITCGKDGMVLFEKGKPPHRIVADSRQVFDVSGAGDTVLAVLGLAMASGASFKEAAELANVAAGVVVGKVGTASVSAEELAKALSSSTEVLTNKYKSLSELTTLTEQFRAEGKTIVMTNGCFDLLHVGHVRLLSASKKMGDVLIVAIDDDDSVRVLKGKDRPVIGAQERLGIISALDCVDYVTLFSTSDLERLIEVVRPNILTKGSNYTTETVLGREIVERFNGRIALVQITDPVSSTQIINQIKQQAV